MGIWHKRVWQHIDDVVENPAIRDLLRSWTEDRRALPAGARPALRDFVTRADDPRRRDWMLLQREGDDFRYRHYGSAIADASGFDMTGRTTLEFGGELAEFFVGCYREVCARGEALYTVHYSDRARNVLTWERLILPVRDEQGGDWLVVYNTPLESRQQLLESVLNASTDAILALRLADDGATGMTDAMVSVANQRAIELLGLPGHDHIGWRVGALMPDWAALGLDPHCTAALAQRAPVDFECRVVLSGQTRRLAGQVAPMRDGVMLRFSDVTELRAMETRLHESEKLNAIGTLAGGVAHDFNNLLAAILGHGVLARDHLTGQDGALLHLDQIESSARRARSLVHQILAFSRSRAPAFEVLSLPDLLDEALPLLRTSLPAGADLVVERPGCALRVLADATQIHQVLMNLVVNAAQALDGRAGRITVGMADRRSPGVAPGLPAEPGVHLWVADTGCGMDEATRRRIFEPFFTTKPVGKGTGLGLSVVHGIVAAHRGAIEVASAPGQGSTFHLWLPAAEGDIAVATALPSAQPRPGRGQHVLVIDDDEVVATVIESLLVRAGYRVTVHTDGPAAVAQVQERPLAFDLALTDFNMPGLSGLAVAKALWAARPDLPVMIASGFIDDALRGQAAQAGVHGLLYKEHLTDTLVPQVQRLLER